jgi:hypothetical protein
MEISSRLFEDKNIKEIIIPENGWMFGNID